MEAGGTEVDGVLSAIAHPIRRRILELTLDRPATVGALAEAFDCSLAAVSKHLKTLEEARLIERRVEWRTHYISARPERLAGAETWIAAQTAQWRQRLEQLKQIMEQDNGPDREHGGDSLD